jgi:hypothetical protein
MTLFAAAAAVQPGPPAPKLRAALVIGPLSPTVTVTATPTTISFTGTNPATAPLVAGSAQAVVTWSYNGTHLNPWNLTVSALSTPFTGCSTVPISAVTVTCSSATLTGNGAGGAAGCSPASKLSTAATQVASGTQNSNTGTYTVNLTFALADSWNYIATTGQACSLTLTYNATLQ